MIAQHYSRLLIGMLPAEKCAALGARPGEAGQSQLWRLNPRPNIWFAGDATKYGYVATEQRRSAADWFRRRHAHHALTTTAYRPLVARNLLESESTVSRVSCSITTAQLDMSGST